MNFKKYLGLILIVIFLCLGLYFLNFKEGFTATSCTQFTNCAECVNGKVIDTTSPCYWNNEKNKCGSFNDSGYSRLCYPTPLDPTPTPPEPTPTPPEPTPTPSPCPICKQCPKLTLLKNPTFITKQ